MTEVAEQLSTALADRYTIERRLGEGGMATVYLARDVKHQRQVALKVLKPELAAVLGSERFLQEIAVTANLQHPNILPLYDSGEARSFLYYTMPHIEGDSLRAKLDRTRQLPVKEAVKIAEAVAVALQFAHERGIVHRDIKPENILLQDGQALVADFGVALAVNKVSSKRLTETGLSIGTPQYMSPEQATGDRELGPRSDVYSLGAVLYEMLAGEPPHVGSSTQAIVAKLLTDRPTALSVLRDTVSPSLEEAVHRALAKAPADRFDTARDFAAAITSPASVATRTLARTKKTTRRAVSWASVALAFVAMVLLLGRGRPTDDGNERTTLLTTQITTSGQAGWSEISPDGRYVAYASVNPPRTFVREIDGAGEQEIWSSAASNISWSRDGSRLFLSNFGLAGNSEGMLISVPLVGGESAQQNLGTGMYRKVAPDGRSLLGWLGGSPWLIVRTDGDKTEHHFPSEPDMLENADWHPSGESIVATLYKDDISYLSILQLDDGTETVILRDSSQIYSAFWSADGQSIWYLRSGVSTVGGSDEIWQVEVSSEASGRPTPVVDGMSVAENPGVTIPRKSFSIDAAGEQVIYTHLAPNVNLWLYTRGDGGWDEGRQITHGTSRHSYPALSPGTGRVAFSAEIRNARHIFVMDLESGEVNQLTFGDGLHESPAWSPDGERIAFGRDADGNRRVGIVEAKEGTEAPTMFADSRLGESLNVRWATGSSIMYHTNANRNYRLLDPATGDETPLVAVDSVGWLFFPLMSPEGDGVFGFWERMGNTRQEYWGGLWWFDLATGEQTRVESARIAPIAWTSGGDSVITVGVMRVDSFQIYPVAGGQNWSVPAPPCSNVFSLTVSSDLKTAVCVRDRSMADVLVVELKPLM